MPNEPKACYRFIPVNSKAVPGPVSLKEISHSRPMPGHLSGCITVEWKAETPICVGRPEVEGNDKVDTPFCLPGEKYALPGPSLKGMIRSVLEIATFSHLGRINDHHHFGYRDFNNPEYRKHVEPNQLNAGWLKYDGKSWQFAKAGTGKGFALLPIDKLVALLSTTKELITSYKWSADIKSAKVKRAKINKFGYGPGMIFFEANARHNDWDLPEVTKIEQKYQAKFQEGYIVCANGIKNGNQRYEAIFSAPDTFENLPEGYIKDFAFLHSKMSKNTMEPEGNWAEWLKDLGYPNPLNAGSKPAEKKHDLPGIPVYYCGTPPVVDASANNFYMGFSRVIKIPYRKSVGDVAKRTVGQTVRGKYVIPPLDEAIDFARAIFGDVEGSLPSDKKLVDKNLERKALKGRVAFGFAVVQPGGTGKAKPECVQETMMMGPKASFWPFYLKDINKPGYAADYNSNNAILAGRKRYPVRMRASSLPAGGNKPEQNTKMRFLPIGNVFSGEIRFHNLHPVELGALIWSLNFGDFTGKSNYCHAMGRAKGYGYGRLKPCIKDFWTSENCPQDKLSVVEALKGFVDEFICHMDCHLAKLGYKLPFNESPAVVALRAMADPEKDSAKLGVLSLNNFCEVKKQWENRTMLCDYVAEEAWQDMRP